VSPPLAGVGEFICGRASDVKIMVEGGKRIKSLEGFKKKWVSSNFYFFNS
jgi:hypothetical protein